MPSSTEAFEYASLYDTSNHVAALWKESTSPFVADLIPAAFSMAPRSTKLSFVFSARTLFASLISALVFSSTSFLTSATFLPACSATFSVSFATLAVSFLICVAASFTSLAAFSNPSQPFLLATYTPLPIAANATAATTMGVFLLSALC